MYDLIIGGGGPGGAAAGVYAARKKLKTLLITDSWGGQSKVSADIQNWIGTKSISGVEFAAMLEEHVKAQEGIEIVDNDKVKKIEKQNSHFLVETKSGKKYETKTFLVATGARRRKLGVPGEQEFDGRGVAYCATCDAPLFKDKNVAVVGGGNAGLEAVLDLLKYAKSVKLLERSNALKGDPVTQDEIKKQSDRVEIILNADTQEIIGDKFVTGLRYKNLKTGEEKILDVQGVFVEIGTVPNTEYIDFVDKNKLGEIIVDHKTQRASVEGIWAVGDASDVLYKQNNISAGDAVKAVMDITTYLHKQK